MPLYNTASCAIALNVSLKWLDNLLSHYTIEGVQQARQGIPRRLSQEAIEIIAITRALTEATDLPIASALKLSQALSQTSTIPLTSFLSITLDREHLEQALADQLAHATEITPQRTRGRPTKRNQGAL